MSDGQTPEETIRNGADAVQCRIEAMREAGRPIPAPSRAQVGLRTINIDDHIYRILVEEGGHQGLDPKSVANAALVSGALMLLKRDGIVPDDVKERTKS